MNMRRAALLLAQSMDDHSKTNYAVRQAEFFYLQNPEAVSNRKLNFIRLDPRGALQLLMEFLESVGVYPPDDEKNCIADLQIAQRASSIQSARSYLKDVRAYVRDRHDWLENRFDNDRLEWVWTFGWLYFMYEPEPYLSIYTMMRGKRPEDLPEHISFHSVLVYERKARRNKGKYRISPRWYEDGVERFEQERLAKTKKVPERV